MQGEVHSIGVHVGLNIINGEGKNPGTLEEVQNLVMAEWNKDSPDTNLIVVWLNLTASARKRLFRSGDTNPAVALDTYPMLGDPLHVSYKQFGHNLPCPRYTASFFYL